MAATKDIKKEKEKTEAEAEKETAESAEKAAEEQTAEEAAGADKEEQSEADSADENADGKEKPDPLKEQIKELQDKCMRQMAEFENFRKRTDREKSQMFETGAAHVIEKLLPVVDNFERGLATAPDADQEGGFADGMNKIYKQMVKMLEDLGVTPIEALGKEFDPAFHNAVMQVAATDEYPSGVVANEMQKGYMYHETVIRHSMVAVAE